MIGNDFCTCLTPQYKLKEGSTWECVLADDFVTDVPTC